MITNPVRPAHLAYVRRFIKISTGQQQFNLFNKKVVLVIGEAGERVLEHRHNKSLRSKGVIIIEDIENIKTLFK